MLSKKYYKESARLIKESKDLAQFKEQLIAFCKSENERFSETRFKKALED